MSEIYERIESLCKKSGINITIMCKETEVPRSALSDYKAGRTKSLSTATLSKIAVYFGVSVDYLLGNEEKPTTPAGSELEDLVKDELVGFYGDVKKELTPEDVQDIITLMKIRAEINRQKGK
ncbi:MAG: helix-turn-helix transcriptional regulator [Oscillospiraceae bacterium]|nr:helix-turn-helix transcriptional regulator [Oscillospiraceae bacterium]